MMSDRIRTLLLEIDRAMMARLYTAAIILTLALPDICAALESPRGISSAARYQAWCSKWFLKPYYARHLTAHDMWNLRCGVVHQGRMGHSKLRFQRVIFSLPGKGIHDLNWIPDPSHPHEGSKRCLNLEARIFCGRMMRAVEMWERAQQHNKTVQDNLKLLLQFRPDGLAPWFPNVHCIS